MPSPWTADEWNALHPPGTPVVVTLVDGVQREAQTAGRALAVGQIPMVELAALRGLWPLSMMRPQPPGGSTTDVAD